MSRSTVRSRIAAEAARTGWGLSHGDKRLEHYQRGRHETVVLWYGRTGRLVSSGALTGHSRREADVVAFLRRTPDES